MVTWIYQTTFIVLDTWRHGYTKQHLCFGYMETWIYQTTFIVWIRGDCEHECDKENVV